ncbi:cellulose binding domain-containing protein [Planosporangium sp. 12N6]|uniref:cellulose binding domain-containing protein n=1 Tax=Planosporangium spinosum TaxID=3402278 RepID=UPI003CFAA7CB
MGKHLATGVNGSTDRSGTPGRALLASGIAMGVLLGAAWWAVSYGDTRRQPVTMLAPPSRPVLPAPPSRPVLPAPPTDATPTPSPVGTAEVLPVPPPLPVTPTGTPATPSPAPTPRAPAVPSRRPPRTRPVPPPSPILAHYATRRGGVWDVGYVADVRVTNTSDRPQAFEVRLTLPVGVRVTGQVWNATADRRAGTVTFRGGPLAPGGEIVFGFVADKNPYLTAPAQYEPYECTVNDADCT